MGWSWFGGSSWELTIESPLSYSEAADALGGLRPGFLTKFEDPPGRPSRELLRVRVKRKGRRTRRGEPRSDEFAAWLIGGTVRHRLASGGYPTTFRGRLVAEGDASKIVGAVREPVGPSIELGIYRLVPLALVPLAFFTVVWDLAHRGLQSRDLWVYLIALVVSALTLIVDVLVQGRPPKGSDEIIGRIAELVEAEPPALR